jgi:hypothetical protein
VVEKVFESHISDHVKTSLTETKINGEWKTYRLMSKIFYTPYRHGKYLGKSTDIRVDGVVQRSRDVEYHFWETVV